MTGIFAPAANAPSRAKCIHRCRCACSCRTAAEGVVLAMATTYRPGYGSAMELVHERRGSGEPLVLLHGIGSRWQVFAPVIDDLAAEFEVWAVDMPGFGASPPASPPIASIPDL